MKQVVFEETKCNIHLEVIDRICFKQECQQKLLCENCEIEHRDHRGKVITYEILSDNDHHLNKVIIDQDIFENMQQYFDEFRNKVSQVKPHQLILQNLEQSLTNNELQQNIQKLCRNILFGDQNEIIFYINQNEFCQYYKEQISRLFKQFSDYWQQEPQSQPLQQQFQQENNFLQSVIMVNFSEYNLSSNLQVDPNKIIYKINDSKLFDVDCLGVSVEKYPGPYIFKIQKLIGVIGIGIARLDLLKKHHFQLNGIERIDMITNERVSYNSKDQQFNCKDSYFEMNESLEYKLSFNKSKRGLDFIIENYKHFDKKFQMEVQYDQNFQYVVFVFLHKQGSEIKLLN